MSYLLPAILITSILAITTSALAGCPDGMYPVRAHLRSSYYRSDGTFVSNAHVDSHCKDYRSDGPLELIYKEKAPDNYPYAKEKFHKCSDSKVKKVNELFPSFHKTLKSVGKINIYCAKKSSVYSENPASAFIEQKTIILYDSAFKSNLRRILLHELSHFLYSYLGQGERDSYLKSAEWIQEQGPKEPTTKRTVFSLSDGALSAEEDFANNVELYFSEYTKFKTDFPEIHKWVNSFFESIK